MKDHIRIRKHLHLIQTICLIFLLAVPLGYAGTRAISFSRVNPFLGQDIQKSLDAAVTEFKVPGVVLGMRDMDGNTRFWTSGTADLKSGKPMSEDLYFRIGSVTKSYTATIVLQLVDEGKISLNDPIGKHLPGLVPREDEITVRHLLEMRSGLGSYGTNEEFAKMAEAQPGRAWTPEELIRLSSSTIGDPGMDFDYNNANYILLGILIEKVTGDCFRKQVTQRILQPLGMSHTFVPTDMEMPAPFAHGYLVEDDKVVDGTDCLHPTAAWSAGNIISTAGDQLIWAKALVEGRLLSPRINAERFIMSAMLNKPGLYGLGVINVDGIIGHGGNYSNAYTSFVGRHRGYDFVILVNGMTRDIEAGDFRALSIIQKLIKETGL
jgi:D-alanyl-D-alanine carboxypeptidase